MRDRTCAIARESIGCAPSPGTDVAAPCTVFRSNAATCAPGGDWTRTSLHRLGVQRDLKPSSRETGFEPATARAVAGTIHPCRGGNGWRRAVPIASALGPIAGVGG